MKRRSLLLAAPVGALVSLAGCAGPRIDELAQELPRWVHGPHGPLPGLVNRRQAELLHGRQP
jgi:hypothetical protein